MRECELTWFNREENKMETVAGLFHQWGTVVKENDKAFVQKTVAIVERLDTHEIIMEVPNKLVFSTDVLDEQESEELGVKSLEHEKDLREQIRHELEVERANEFKRVAPIHIPEFVLNMNVEQLKLSNRKKS